MKKFLGFIPMVVVALLLVGCQNKPNETSEPRPSVDVTADQTIQSPLTLHINSKGVWQAHEGELGSVTLTNEKGEELGSAIMKSEDGNWMTNDPAPFVSSLKFSVPEDQNGMLTFRNNFISDEGGDTQKEFSIPVKISATPNAPAMGEAVASWCFAEKTEAMNSPQGMNYNYQFIKIDTDGNNNVSGWIISSPYGTDGMRGHLSGKYDPDSKALILDQIAMGEGQMYEQQRNFKLGENKLLLDYGNPDNSQATLKLYDCSEFDALFKEFEKGIIAKQVNTTDRSRLLQIENLKEIGYTEGQLKKLRFMELETDLDNDFSNQEYLIYVMDPMLCGTGGCSLYIVDGKGNTLSYMTVTKLPVYTVMPTAASQQTELGKWRDLYVWSNGAFRQLKHNGTSYPMNPSTETEVSELEITYHPEKYRILLNYLN